MCLLEGQFVDHVIVRLYLNQVLCTGISLIVHETEKTKGDV